MDNRRGKCINFGNCVKADRKEIIELGFTEDFVCPECESDLIEEAKPASAPVGKILGIVAVVALLGGLGFGAFKLFSGGEKKEKVAEADKTVQSEEPAVILPPEMTIAMTYVQGGTFTMGCTSEQGGDCVGDEKPSRQITLSSFNIGTYEITQAQWVAVMNGNPSHFKGNDLPVEMVSWTDVQEFIRKLNAATGMEYRLPTEAEWEYAARGGAQSRGSKYSGGSNVSDVAWFINNSGGKTHPVGSKQPNELGIYDMSGNVHEWCSDWYGNYSGGAQTNPQGHSSGSRYVNRGGSWDRGASGCRVAIRNDGAADARFNFLGLRLATNSTIRSVDM